MNKELWDRGITSIPCFFDDLIRPQPKFDILVYFYCGVPDEVLLIAPKNPMYSKAHRILHYTSLEILLAEVPRTLNHAYYVAFCLPAKLVISL